jgi:glutamate N-acetyltransferase/amino-acid N-acetyltransferase
MEWLEGRGVTAPSGFSAGAARGGLKTSGDDVALLVGEPGTTAAGVFTTNRVKAAPLLVSARHLQSGQARAVVVNAGNANCLTGEQGRQSALGMAQAAAEKIGAQTSEVLVCSTGIIGHPLPLDKVKAALVAIELGHDDERTARAFMTTDLVPKFVAASAEIGGQWVTVGGQAKGVGMIGPKLAPLHATMLAFFTTDAAIEASLLQKLLEEAVRRSFNSVTVDGDTSTNDTALLFASGQGAGVITRDNAEQFAQLLLAVCVQLARKIARDGEGATRLVEIEVSGAANEEDAQKVALTVANSPLVKTAIFGGDPNWGRIAMAAGRAGVAFEPEALSFSLGGVSLFHRGEPVAFDQKKAEAALAGPEVTIKLNLGQGVCSWTAWTCDFSYEYVKINAEYHT